jgi:hypothetical protein
MRKETDTMTHTATDHTSTQDVMYRIAQDRIGDLRASAPTTQSGAPTPAGSTAPVGLVDRARDALGRRLILLGGSVVADEGLRRRALHL